VSAFHIVPQLADRLDGPEIGPALEALRAIGEPARAALPRLAALSSHMDVRLTQLEDCYLFIWTVVSVARRPDDTHLALRILSTVMTKVPSLLSSTAEAMLMFGLDGRNAVLSYLHSDDNTVEHRLDVARILQRAGLAESRRSARARSRAAARHTCAVARSDAWCMRCINSMRGRP
jgi:hypothetical protein